MTERKTPLRLGKTRFGARLAAAYKMSFSRERGLFGDNHYVGEVFFGASYVDRCQGNTIRQLIERGQVIACNHARRMERTAKFDLALFESILEGAGI
jgi:hypothetical protein